MLDFGGKEKKNKGKNRNQLICLQLDNGQHKELANNEFNSIVCLVAGPILGRECCFTLLFFFISLGSLCFSVAPLEEINYKCFIFIYLFFFVRWLRSKLN